MSVYYPVTQISGLGLYGVLITPGKQWVNVITPEAFNSANWAGYVQTTADEGNGVYWVTIPAGLAAGTYLLAMYLPTTPGTKAFGDIPYFDTPFSIRWTGTAIEPVAPTGFAFVNGTVTGTPSTTIVAGDSGLSSVDSFYHRSNLAFTSGSLKGMSRIVSTYNGSARAFTFFNAWPNAPTAGDTFMIIGGSS